MPCSSVNYCSALAAAVTAFAFGFVWYHEAVWGATLMAALGTSPNDAGPMTAKLVVEFVKLCAVSIAVSAIAAGLHFTTALDAFKLSVVIGVGIVGTTIISGLHWADVPPVVAAVDVSYAYVTILIFSLFGCLCGKRAPTDALPETRLQ